jgi:hypothetical protein
MLSLILNVSKYIQFIIYFEIYVWKYFYIANTFYFTIYIQHFNCNTLPYSCFPHGVLLYAFVNLTNYRSELNCTQCVYNKYACLYVCMTMCVCVCTHTHTHKHTHTKKEIIATE